MNKFFTAIILLLSVFTASAQQKVIQLYNGRPQGSEDWTWNEAENDHNGFNTKVVYNVSQPTLTAFLPDTSRINPSGTAVIICPGGGFQALSINSEGNDVAEWLKKKGIAAFVLRYRLVHTKGTDPVKELGENQNSAEHKAEREKVVRLAIADGKTALAYVRAHAAEFGVSPDRIGIIGFSAGGTVAAASAYDYTAANKPDFVAPVYAYIPAELEKAPPVGAPPMFIAAASNDGLGLGPHSVNLYNRWIAAGLSAELHMYAKGGHGFGMRKQNLPSDNFIDRFGDWLDMLGYVDPIKPTPWFKTTAKKQSEFDKWLDFMVHTDWPNLHAYAESDSIVKSNLKNEKRVVFMGNSITQVWSNIHPEFFKERPYIINRGISGQTTSQMLVRFRQDVIELKPAAVVILAGINDIAQNTGPITIENIFGNIVSMAELAKANNIKVALSSVMPAATISWRPGIKPIPQIIKLNGLIKAYAEKNHIDYIDYYTVMVDKNLGLDSRYTNEGLHPNLNGYKKMEPIVQKVIDQLLAK